MLTWELVRKIDGFKGDARLYKLSDPIRVEPWDDENTETTDHVIVSAANAPFSGPETYIFSANADGDVLDWGEHEGSFRGGFDHDRALRGLAAAMESESQGGAS